MSNNPISDPSDGVSGVPPSRQAPGEEPGQLKGKDPERPFSIEPGPQGGEGPKAASGEAVKSPMEAASEAASKHPDVTPQTLSGRANDLSDQFKTFGNKLQDPNVSKNLTDEHYKALGQVTDRLGQDMKTVSKHTGVPFEAPSKEGGSIKDFLINYMHKSSGTMHNVMVKMSNTDSSNWSYGQGMGTMYAMQRAQQRLEMMTSIVGTGVSGIKSLMSMQLG